MTWRRHAARLFATAGVAAAMLGSARAAQAPTLEEGASDHTHFPSYISPYLSCLPDELPAHSFPQGPGRVPSRTEAWGTASRIAYARVPKKAHLIERQIAVESGYLATAVSDVGAVGLLQILPSTAEWLGRRVMDAQEVSCVLERSGNKPSGNYVGDLKLLSWALERGEVPYNLARRLDERYDDAQNIATGIDYHQRFGLGRRPDHIVFLTYIAGADNVKNNTNIGTASRAYFPKILNTDLDDYLPATRGQSSSL